MRRAVITDEGKARPTVWHRARRWAGIVWMLCVTIWFVHEAQEYSGIFAKVSEWEFETFGISWPLATAVLLCTAFMLPGMLLLPSAQLRERPDGAELSPSVISAARNARFFGVVAKVTGLVMAAFLAVAAMQPGAGGPARTIDAEHPNQDGPVQGHTRLSGVVVPGLMAALEEASFGERRATYLAPVMPPPGQSQFRYFVEIGQSDGTRPDQRAVSRVIDGILVQKALPGPLRKLYTNAGYQVAAQDYVLYQRRISIMLPYLAAAAQVGFVALIACGLWFWQSRRLRYFSTLPREDFLEFDTGMDLPKDDTGLRPAADLAGFDETR